MSFLAPFGGGRHFGLLLAPPPVAEEEADKEHDTHGDGAEPEPAGISNEGPVIAHDAVELLPGVEGQQGSDADIALGSLLVLAFVVGVGTGAVAARAPAPVKGVAAVVALGAGSLVGPLAPADGVVGVADEAAALQFLQ